jgi:hypothetical protein
LIQEMIQSALRPFAVVALAPLLAGCLLSGEPLFSEDSAETPFEPGRYEVAQIDEAGETYEPLDKLTLSLAGKTYAMVEDRQQERIEFTLHPIGEGLLVAMASAEEGHGYALLRPEGDMVFGWAATCQVAEKLGLLEKHGIETDGLSCGFEEAEKLTAFLIDYAGAEQPDYRYRQIAE